MKSKDSILLSISKFMIQLLFVVFICFGISYYHHVCLGLQGWHLCRTPEPGTQAYHDFVWNEGEYSR